MVVVRRKRSAAVVVVFRSKSRACRSRLFFVCRALFCAGRVVSVQLSSACGLVGAGEERLGDTSRGGALPMALKLASSGWW